MCVCERENVVICYLILCRDKLLHFIGWLSEGWQEPGCYCPSSCCKELGIHCFDNPVPKLSYGSSALHLTWFLYSLSILSMILCLSLSIPRSVYMVLEINVSRCDMLVKLLVLYELLTSFFRIKQWLWKVLVCLFPTNISRVMNI